MSDKLHAYSSDSIEVTYNAKRCIHAAACVHGLPTVFDPEKRPWVSPEAASAEDVATVISRCPTGALQYARKDDGPAESIPDKNTIHVRTNGPLHVRGDLQMPAGDDGEAVRETRLALCRCGASANKPFCDNSHAKAEFKAEGSVRDNREEAGEITPTGALEFTPVPNGPVLIKGNFEIRSMNGSSSYVGEKAALCRCGASSNKPFCDGTHKEIGFEAA